MINRTTRRLFASLPTRNSKYAELSAADIDFFTRTLGQSGLVRASDQDLAAYNSDWMNKYHGRSQLVLRPRSTLEISAILKYCNDRRLAVVPQGGNTGLVGGGVPVHDELVLSTSRMTDILSFDSISGALVCQAGCVLEKLDDYVSERGYMMPIDLGAKGSCHIGGNLATNAGGLRLLRYGSLHGSVLGVEAVLADGTILSDLKTLRKDNTGTDLKQLFIGSEGTLGIISAVSILTPSKPRSVNVAVVAVPSFEGVQRCFAQAKSHLGEILSAFEFFDKDALELVLKHQDGRALPFNNEGGASPFYVLLETSGSRKEHDDEKLSDLLEELMANDTITDGTLAQDETQLRALWNIREGIPEACSKSGAVYKYDISMPLPQLYKLVEDMRTRLNECGLYNPGQPGKGPVKSVIGYGHVGDGNLHLNISADKYSTEVTDAIEPFVYEWTQRVNGSISAEHGLGVMKKDYIGYSKSPAMVAVMQQLKHTLDPNGILNPYKFLPDTCQ